MKQPASFAIIFNECGELLILQRRDVPVWTLPGGGIDAGESPEEAVVREVNEETGLDVVVVRKVALYSPVNGVTAFTHTFECRVVGGDLIESNESNGLRFCSLSLLPRAFFFVHGKFLEDALRRYPEVINTPLKCASYPRLVWYALCHPWIAIRFLLKQ
jgi:8-oxo-dGTP diphosphatase